MLLKMIRLTALLFGALIVFGSLPIAAPSRAATYSQPIAAALGAAHAGLGTAFGYTVYDSTGTIQIARTTSGVTELTDNAGAAAGTYTATITVNTTWFPARVHWDATGQTGLIADTVIGAERAATIADGLTNARIAKLDNADTTVSSAVAALTALQNALTPVTGAVNDAGATTSSFVTNLPTTSDIYSGDGIVFTSGAMKGKPGHILSFNTATGAVTLAGPLPSTPANGVTFTLIPFNKALVQFAANLGTDSKVVLSANTQPAIAASNLPTEYLSSGEQASLSNASTTATTVNTKLGSPAGASIAADVAALPNSTRDAILTKQILANYTVQGILEADGLIAFGTAANTFHADTKVLDSIYTLSGTSSTLTNHTAYGSATTSIPQSSRTGVYIP